MVEEKPGARTVTELATAGLRLFPVQRNWYRPATKRNWTSDRPPQQQHSNRAHEPTATAHQNLDNNKQKQLRTSNMAFPENATGPREVRIPTRAAYPAFAPVNCLHF